MKKDERNKDKRNTCLLTRWSGHCRDSIHKTMKKLRKKRGLGWLCVKIVHKCHNNLKEMLLGDIQQKGMMGIETAKYAKKIRKKKSSCCHDVDDHCLYREGCETACVIYEITCIVRIFMWKKHKDL